FLLQLSVVIAAGLVLGRFICVAAVTAFRFTTLMRCHLNHCDGLVDRLTVELSFFGPLVRAKLVSFFRNDPVSGFVCPNQVQPRRKCWFDRDDPSGSGDWETLSDLRKENPGMICRNPFAIDVQSLDGESGDVFYRNDPKTGFVCRNKDQPGRKMCSDYRVRFLCKPPFCVGGFV
uniref:WxxW domain-containing protein n=1 Tax=Amphiprion ocellaris TaxID=80972 RepID=A0AAQ5YLS3_AMPOC